MSLFFVPSRREMAQSQKTRATPFRLLHLKYRHIYRIIPNTFPAPPSWHQTRVRFPQKFSAQAPRSHLPCTRKFVDELFLKDNRNFLQIIFDHHHIIYLTVPGNIIFSIFKTLWFTSNIFLKQQTSMSLTLFSGGSRTSSLVPTMGRTSTFKMGKLIRAKS